VRNLSKKISGAHFVPQNAIDSAILALLAFALAFAALAFGAVEAWSQLLLITLIGVLLCVVLLRSALDAERPVTPNWMWLPAGALVLLTLVQLLPLPSGVVEVLDPNRAAAFEPLLPSDEATASYLPLTFSPLNTRHSLRLAFMTLGLLVIVTAAVQTRSNLQKLLAIVFAVGCAESALAIAQIATNAKKLYWTVDAGEGGLLTAGSLVNHSHFSQLVNASIGAGVALLLMRWQRDDQQKLRRVGSWSNTTPAEFLRQYGWILAGLALCVFAVCLSLSRNGILSLAIGTAFVGGLLARQKSLGWRAWAMSLVPLAVFASLLLFGLDDFYERMISLENGSQYTDRWALSQSSFEAGTYYPLFGMGIGSFAVAFPPFDTTGSASVAEYADNDYAQLFAEAGVAGFALLFMLLAVVGAYLVYGLRHYKSSAAQAAFGILLALIAVAIHSFTDFGQRIPAVFLLSVTLCGLLARLPVLEERSRRRRTTSSDLPVSLRQRVLGTTSALVAAGCFGWAISDAYGHYQAETWWAIANSQEQRLSSSNWKGEQADYEKLLIATESRLAWEPSNEQAHFWLNFYRWMAVANLTDTTSGDEAWMASVYPSALRIADDLAILRSKCPVYHRPYTLEGQLRGNVLGDAKSASLLLARGAALASSDAEAHFVYGEWIAQHGERAEAIETLQETVALNGGYYAGVCQVLLDDLSDPATASELAGDDPRRLGELLKLAQEREAYKALADDLAKRVDDHLSELVRSGSATANQSASFAERAARTGDFEQAAKLYRQALASNYNQFEWRYKLAIVLRDAQKYDEAMREVRMCRRLRPNDARVKELAEELVLEVDR